MQYYVSEQLRKMKLGWYVLWRYRDDFRIGTLIRMEALINKNTFEGGRLSE